MNMMLWQLASSLCIVASHGDNMVGILVTVVVNDNDGKVLCLPLGREEEGIRQTVRSELLLLNDSAWYLFVLIYLLVLYFWLFVEFGMHADCKVEHTVESDLAK